MVWKKLGQGLAKGAANAVNMIDEVVDTIRNTAINTVDNFHNANANIRNTYNSTRLKSPKIQREIEEGTRSATGSKPKIKEAVNSGQSTESVINLTRASRNTDTYFNYNGSNYRHTTSKDANNKIVHHYGKQQSNGTYTEISGQSYGKAKHNATKNNTNFYASEEDLMNATRVAESGPAEAAGINLEEFINNHPVITGGALVGGGILIGELLDDD